VYDKLPDYKGCFCNTEGSIAGGFAARMGGIMFRKLRIAIHKFLLEMAKDNQELYGKDRMDCCKLNSDHSKKR